jgi:glucose-1-phosphate adenylyltransferase
MDVLAKEPKTTDFGKEIFPASIKPRHVQAHVFDGYWEDVGTIKSYHEASLALASENPPFDFHSPEGVIYTRMRFLPASRLTGTRFEQCLISDGCVVQTGSQIEHSVLGVRSQVGKNVRIRDAVIIGADRYETEAEKKENARRSIPNLGVGEGSVIERAILDKDARVGRSVQIINRRGVVDEEGRNYMIRDGIVVIPKAQIIADGTVI